MWCVWCVERRASIVENLINQSSTKRRYSAMNGGSFKAEGVQKQVQREHKRPARACESLDKRERRLLQDRLAAKVRRRMATQHEIDTYEQMTRGHGRCKQETDEERLRRLSKDRQHQQSAEVKAKRKARFRKESQDQKKARLEKDNLRRKLHRWSFIDDREEEDRKGELLKSTLQFIRVPGWTFESPKERSRRLSNDRTRHQEKFKNETPEQYTQRLDKQRQYARDRRAAQERSKGASKQRAAVRKTDPWMNWTRAKRMEDLLPEKRIIKRDRELTSQLEASKKRCSKAEAKLESAPCTCDRTILHQDPAPGPHCYECIYPRAVLKHER